ncbi:hypothetical protein ARMGADRAFT_1065913 [Armillaria gallica]|uniref:Uncharacterized protein n=1 Tax=Armillaria gallica TaxID=47427 RepID=A0A2H3D1R9_ARMGA|nr:hypothetical protein ARMGADRAFT_1065913 [Armillaria gallica]
MSCRTVIPQSCGFYYWTKMGLDRNPQPLKIGRAGTLKEGIQCFPDRMGATRADPGMLRIDNERDGNRLNGRRMRELLEVPEPPFKYRDRPEGEAATVIKRKGNVSDVWDMNEVGGTKPGLNSCQESEIFNVNFSSREKDTPYARLRYANADEPCRSVRSWSKTSSRGTRQLSWEIFLKSSWAWDTRGSLTWINRSMDSWSKDGSGVQPASLMCSSVKADTLRRVSDNHPPGCEPRILVAQVAESVKSLSRRLEADPFETIGRLL